MKHRSSPVCSRQQAHDHSTARQRLNFKHFVDAVPKASAPLPGILDQDDVELPRPVAGLDLHPDIATDIRGQALQLLGIFVK